MKAVFLDRDGVLNHAVVQNGKPYPPAVVSEMTIPEDVYDALQLLKNAGFLLIGATNQPDVARGTTSKTTIEAINAKLMQTLPLTEIAVCYHDDAENCDCRKPKPGLLTAAAKKYALDLKQCFMIGDRWRDIEAGQKANCRTIWLNHQYSEKSPNHPDFVTTTLLDAASWIIQQIK